MKRIFSLLLISSIAIGAFNIAWAKDVPENNIAKKPENEILHKTTYYYLDFENKEITYAMNIEVNIGLHRHEEAKGIIAKSKSCEWILEKLESNKASLLEKSSIDKSIEEDIER